MSARGARSRKIQQKEIEKKGKKEKGKAPEPIHEDNDTFTGWRPTPSISNSGNGLSLTPTASSNHSCATSCSSSTQDGSSRPRLNPCLSDISSEIRSARRGSASVSDTSSKDKERTRYETKGRQTKAPRGRGGGVPVKKDVTAFPAAPHFSSDSHGAPTHKTWMNFKIWEQGRDTMRSYGGFELDEDMQNGSVFIYFKEEQVDEDHPIPSIRAELEVLQNSGSTWLSNALLYGQIDDGDFNDWDLTEVASSSSGALSPRYHPPAQRRMLGPTSLGGRSPPPFDIDMSDCGIESRAASRAQCFSETSFVDRSDSPPPFRRRASQCNPSHEIWFTAPSKIKSPQGQRLHHIAIRNFMAMLHDKPIVGADLFDMLSTLQPEIQIMYDLDSDPHSRMTSRERSVQMIINYLGRHGLDDLRNNVRRALGLIAWAEQDSVRWRQGYLESFVHLAGVMKQEIEDHPDFKRLSVVTRRNLGLAGKTLQLCAIEAEEKLSSFDFSDLWEDTVKATASPVYQSYQSFRQFLVSHLKRTYGNWPPNGQMWLNRKVVNAMQESFGSLYDYLVDQDVVWNPLEQRASRKWEMAHRRNNDFKADSPELGITDMLVAYDSKNGYEHIPHPYPLLPRDVPKVEKDKEKKNLFSSLKKDKSKDATKDAKARLQLSILFSDATNIEKLDVNFNDSTLIDAFEQFELSTNLKHTSPREARLGRWVLLYAILQILSTLSVDVQNLKHTDGVRYFLCTDLKRTPEWVTNNQTSRLEATQQRSWCWQRAWDPTPTQSAPVELEAPPTSPNSNYNYSYPEQTGITRPSFFPTPPPQKALPAPPPPDAATLMAKDIHRLGEKINISSLSPPHNNNNNNTSTTHQDQDQDQDGTHRRHRRRENEKVSRDEFQHRKLASGAFAPRGDSLLNQREAHSHLGKKISPRGRGPLYDDGDGDAHAHAHVYSTFGTEDVRWPVPPGYSEAGLRQRESGVLGRGDGEEGMRERGGWEWE